MRKIGIVGNGYVGGAIAHGFSPAATGTCEVKVYDVLPERATHSLYEVVNDSEFIFVSVPTPMNKNGSISLKLINDAFKQIDDINEQENNIVILKSTVVPGTTEKLQKKYPKLNIVFNPEFLTEKSARLDFINQTRIVLGGNKIHTSQVAELFNERFKYCHIIQTDFKTSEMIKYFCNVFFSVKVSFANEMKIICDTIGADWDKALEGFVADGRIGDSHLNVPGPDGKWGFGGSCFPKDINAFMSFAKSVGANINTIKGAWKTNLEVRPERDWEELKGRAIVED
tara:strand:+ start:431 stop:1282 length:852 start_codon:yes stop_codon:yes gene_type:complete